VHAAPDLERLEKFVDQSFAELRAGAGAVAKTAAEVAARPQRQKRVRPNGRIPVGDAKIPIAKKRTVRKKAQTNLKSRPAAPVAASATPQKEPEKTLAVGA